MEQYAFSQIDNNLDLGSIQSWLICCHKFNTKNQYVRAILESFTLLKLRNGIDLNVNGIEAKQKIEVIDSKADQNASVRSVSPRASLLRILLSQNELDFLGL